MTADPAHPRRELRDLSEAECWELLAGTPAGRLAWSAASGIAVVPVNHAVHGRTVVVRTTAYSALARECDDSPVAFEIDHLDPQDRGGWSVLARGVAHVELASAPGPDVDVWPTGPRPLRVRIDVTGVSGRRVA